MFLLVPALAMLAACSTTLGIENVDSSDRTLDENEPWSDPNTTGDSTDTQSDGGSGADDQTEEIVPAESSELDEVWPDYRAFLADAIPDIEQFWRDNYSLVYRGDYTELEGGVHAHFPDNPADLPVGCAFVGDYSDVEENAFYCDEGDFIVYDDAVLFPDFADEFGMSVTALVIAHEWGHAIQGSNRNDILYSYVSTTIELQADCFAGAWVADAQRNGVKGVRLSDRDVTSALLGLIQLGDVPGGLPDDPAAHGSAFDRVSAFQDGYLGGVVPCAGYEESEPLPLQFGFTLEELQRPNPSDFPFDREMFDLLTGDLALYWNVVAPLLDADWIEPTVTLVAEAETPPTCAERIRPAPGVWFCPRASRLVVDVDLAKRVYDEIPGDFAVAYLLALGYAESVRQTLPIATDGEQAALLNDCLAGMWTGDILPFNTDPAVESTEETPRVGLSPGDLDEAIRLAILIGDESFDTDVVGSPFEKVDAFRQGVFFGAAGCR